MQSGQMPRQIDAIGHAATKAPLVGRGPEMRELEEAFARAYSAKSPEVVTILGGQGIGKTRLLNEFLQRVRDRERRVAIYRGTFRDGGSTFSAIQRILRARFGVFEGADPDTTREAFRKTVAEALGDKRVTEFLHFLGAFLDLRFPESPFIKAVEDDPEQFSQLSRAVLRRFFEVDAEAAPLVLTFEDLHHATEDALGLVHYLLSTVSHAPILIVNTARPDLLARRANWFQGHAKHTRIDVGPLGADDAALLMQKLLAPTGAEPPGELVDAAVDMAAGSPYLLEQTVRTYFDSGTLAAREDGSWAVDLSRLDEAQLPLTVDDAVAQRVSSLTQSERSLLEMAASMGGVFWLGGLVALARINKPTPALWGGAEDVVLHFRDLLKGLETREFVVELPDSSIFGDAEYAFRHTEERDALHKLTSASEMRRFHLVIAEWLEFKLTHRNEEQCELLAQHFFEGGAVRKAGEHYIAAGDRARTRYANAKAAEYYARGLSLIGEEDIVLRMDALHHLGDVLQLAGNNEEAIKTFRSMLEIAYRLDLKGKGGAAHNRIGRVYRAIGQLEEAMRHLGTGHALFAAADDRRGVAASLDDVGRVHWMRGSYDTAERFMQDALVIRTELGDPRSIALSQNNLGLVYQDSGRFGEALKAFEEALSVRRQIEDRPGIAQTLNNLGTIHQDNGDQDRAISIWTEALEVAHEVGDRMRQAVILTNIGEAHYRSGRPTEAIRVLKEAEDISTTLGDRLLEAEILRGLAKAHMLIHDISTARDYITRSVALFEQARGKPYLGVALRTLGEIAAAGGWGGEDHKRAREAFERSIRLFEELGNDVELGRSCKACADFLAAAAGDSTDLKALAEKYMRRAEEISDRLQKIDRELPKSPFRPTTDPGLGKAPGR